MEARRDDGAPRAALPGFVATAVLTSSDGLFGDNTEEKRIDDAPMTRDPSAAGDYKPLFERLQERKDQMDKEWKEKNNPYAPPKALDDDEIEFIRGLETRQAATDKQRELQQQEDLAGFLLARESVKQNGAGAAAPLVLPEPTTVKTGKPAAPKAPVVVVKAKRKKTDKSDDKKASFGEKKRKTEAVVVAPSIKAASSSAVSALGLVGYDSDSDSDSKSSGHESEQDKST